MHTLFAFFKWNCLVLSEKTEEIRIRRECCRFNGMLRKVYCLFHNNYHMLHDKSPDSPLPCVEWIRFNFGLWIYVSYEDEPEIFRLETAILWDDYGKIVDLSQELKKLWCQIYLSHDCYLLYHRPRISQAWGVEPPPQILAWGTIKTITWGTYTVRAT